MQIELDEAGKVKPHLSVSTLRFQRWEKETRSILVYILQKRHQMVEGISVNKVHHMHGGKTP